MQFFLLSFVCYFQVINSLTSQSQINLLFLFYNQTNGKYWKWKNEFLFGSKWIFNLQNQNDPCNTNLKSWQGITCSSIPTTCKISKLQYC